VLLDVILVVVLHLLLDEAFRLAAGPEFICLLGLPLICLIQKERPAVDEGHAPGNGELAPLVEAFRDVVQDDNELHDGLERVLRLVHGLIRHVFPADQVFEGGLIHHIPPIALLHCCNPGISCVVQRIVVLPSGLRKRLEGEHTAEVLSQSIVDDLLQVGLSVGAPAWQKERSQRMAV